MARHQSPSVLFLARKRRRALQNEHFYRADIASPFDLGTIGAGNPLPNAYVVPAGARLAVSFSVGVTAVQLTVDIGANTIGTRALLADEIQRLVHAELNEDVVPTCGIAGTVTLYRLSEWQLPIAIASGVFT